MLSKRCAVYVGMVLLGLLIALPAFAGSLVVGSVAGSTNATLGGQTLLPNTTVFSGDSLQVKQGVAVVALGSTSRMVFGHDTVASFLRDSKEITVLLGQGNVSLFQDVDGMPVRMKVGDVSIAPVSGFKTLGEVATLNGAVVVTTKDGMMHVESDGRAVDVLKGKTITVRPKVSAPPQGGGGGAGRMYGTTFWNVLDTGLAAGGLIVAAFALKDASDASDNASKAASEAAAAESAAAAAALAAEQAANAVGCALNILAAEEGEPSPYTPPAGFSCPH